MTKLPVVNNIPSNSDIKQYMITIIMEQALLNGEDGPAILTDPNEFNINANLEQDYGFTLLDKYIIVAKVETNMNIKPVCEDDIYTVQTCQDLIDIVIGSQSVESPVPKQKQSTAPVCDNQPSSPTVDESVPCIEEKAAVEPECHANVNEDVPIEKEPVSKESV